MSAIAAARSHSGRTRRPRRAVPSAPTTATCAAAWWLLCRRSGATGRTTDQLRRAAAGGEHVVVHLKDQQAPGLQAESDVVLQEGLGGAGSPGVDPRRLLLPPAVSPKQVQPSPSVSSSLAAPPPRSRVGPRRRSRGARSARSGARTGFREERRRRQPRIESPCSGTRRCHPSGETACRAPTRSGRRTAHQRAAAGPVRSAKTCGMRRARSRLPVLRYRRQTPSRPTRRTGSPPPTSPPFERTYAVGPSVSS